MKYHNIIKDERNANITALRQMQGIKEEYERIHATIEEIEDLKTSIIAIQERIYPDFQLSTEVAND